MDTFYMGGIKAPGINFYEIVDQENIFTEQAFDGIFGLSKPFSGEKSAFDQMVQDGVFKENVFAFNLARNEGASELSLGGYDKNQLASEIKWFDVIHPSYWMIQLDKVYLKDESSDICNGKCAAIIDSGTSLLTAPQMDLEILTRNITSLFFLSYRGNWGCRLCRL
jgi:phytepsin